MEPLTRLRVGDWTEALSRCAAALDAHASALDRLDVVTKHGDTGTHLTATMRVLASGLAESPCRDLASVAAVMSRGSAPDASGTSGALLAAFLAGGAVVIRNLDSIDAMALAMVFEAGAEAMATSARSSLSEVIDGTIVTVAGEVARVALAAADADGSLAQVALAAADGGLDALEQTPDRQPALAEAGVVDAGAAGFLVLVDVIVAVIHGEGPELEAYEFDDGPVDDDGDDWLRYVVALTIETTAEGSERLVAAWSSLGESVSVVADSAESGERWVAWVTTDDIGAVMEAAIAVGRPSGISVVDRHRPRGVNADG